MNEEASISREHFSVVATESLWKGLFWIMNSWGMEWDIGFTERCRENLQNRPLCHSSLPWTGRDGRGMALAHEMATKRALILSLCIISASQPLPLCASSTRFWHLLLCRETFFVDLPRCLPFSIHDLSFSVELPLRRISLSFSVEFPLHRISVAAFRFQSLPLCRISLSVDLSIITLSVSPCYPSVGAFPFPTIPISPFSLSFSLDPYSLLSISRSLFRSISLCIDLSIPLSSARRPCPLELPAWFGRIVGPRLLALAFSNCRPSPTRVVDQPALKQLQDSSTSELERNEDLQFMESPRVGSGGPSEGGKPMKLKREESRLRSLLGKTFSCQGKNMRLNIPLTTPTLTISAIT
ncbi:hypothetical protein ACLOJK_021517 [Asimina triloba]